MTVEMMTLGWTRAEMSAQAGCTTAVVDGREIRTGRCRRRGRVALGPHDHSRFRRCPGTTPYRLHVVGGRPLPNYPDSTEVLFVQDTITMAKEHSTQEIYRRLDPSPKSTWWGSVRREQHLQISHIPWENRLVPPAKQSHGSVSVHTGVTSPGCPGSTHKH